MWMLHSVRALVLISWLVPFSAIAASRQYPVEYLLKFLPDKSQINVSISIESTHLVRSIDFNLEKSLCTDFEGTGKYSADKQRFLWVPEGTRSTLRYHCSVNHERKSQNRKKSYDAYMTQDWALFRGDDVVPPAKVVAVKRAKSRATLVVELPKNWPGINTGWERKKEEASKQNKARTSTFVVDNPQRRFDRPTGWIIAGKIGTRRAYLGDDVTTAKQISVSAPLDSSMRRMDVLAFTQFVWPQFEKAFMVVPQKFLIVGGDDPLWRGGLSASNSFYMHADRPIISENGTSSLLHEMVHLMTHIQGKKDCDWIAEGVAEFYGIELLQRAGGINERRRQQIVEKLRRRAKNVVSLKAEVSNGRNTAAAVLVFDELSSEISRITEGKKSIDDVTRRLMKKGRVDADDLRQAFREVTGKMSGVLQRAPVR